MLIPASILVF